MEAAKQMRTVIKGGQLLDGTGATPIPEGAVVVEGNRIVAAGNSAELRAYEEGASIVDAAGGTILPGFFDCHVHICHVLANANLWGGLMGRWLEEREQILNGVMQLNWALDAGLTTLRSPGEGTLAIFDMRALTANNSLRGPRIIACGKIICMTGGHGHKEGRECDGVDEVRKATREQIKAGADWIKLAATGGARSSNEKIASTQLDEEEMAMAVHEASKAGLKVCVHALGTAGIKNALRAGVSCIEHGAFLDDEAVQWMVDRDVTLVPTLSVYQALVERGLGMGVEAFAPVRAREVVKHHVASLRLAVKAGVRVAFGTDSGGPYHPIGKDVVMELEMMREAGMTPMQLVQSITGTAAEAMGVGDRLGTLQEGKLADVVIVDGNPLADLAAMGRVKFVMKDGLVFKQ